MSNYQEHSEIQKKRKEMREWVEKQSWYLNRVVKKDEKAFFTKEGLDEYERLVGHPYQPKEPHEDTEIHF